MLITVIAVVAQSQTCADDEEEPRSAGVSETAAAAAGRRNTISLSHTNSPLRLKFSGFLNSMRLTASPHESPALFSEVTGYLEASRAWSTLSQVLWLHPGPRGDVELKSCPTGKMHLLARSK